MHSLRITLNIARSINEELRSIGATNAPQPQSDLYNEIIKNKKLRDKTEKLFRDGHYARAVEEAFKLIDNLVKEKSCLLSSDLTGSKLMQTALSPNKPILKLNEGISTSEKNEQSGYMQIFSGCMTGIRNPRAHDSDWEDSEQRALQLLLFANHLIDRIASAQKSTE